MSDSNRDVVVSAEKELTLADILAAIQANSQQSSAQLAQSEARLSQKISSSQEEVFALVCGDLDRVQSDLRTETSEQVRDVRL